MGWGGKGGVKILKGEKAGIPCKFFQIFCKITPIEGRGAGVKRILVWFVPKMVTILSFKSFWSFRNCSYSILCKLDYVYSSPPPSIFYLPCPHRICTYTGCSTLCKCIQWPVKMLMKVKETYALISRWRCICRVTRLVETQWFGKWMIFVHINLFGNIILQS